MINIKNLSVRFHDEVVLNDFSLVLNSGDKLAITGSSGIGKSTLLNLLAGFIPDFEGEVTLDDWTLNAHNIKEIRKKIAWLPQDLALKFKTVHELFFTPFQFAQNKDSKPAQAEITKLFDQFGLSESLLAKDLKEISGGQKQRIILASCLLLKKPILLLDEPTSALDNQIKKKVADFILGQRDLTVIAVTHDMYWAEKSKKIIHLE